MEISGKKAIRALVQDADLRKLINVVYLFNTQKDLIQVCKQNKVNYEIKSKVFFDTHYSDKTQYKYKYAIALIKKTPELSLDKFLDKHKGKDGLIVILDHIHDPFNLGAILRTCAASNALGVIIPKDNQAPVNHNSVLKASQGYSLKIDVVSVANLHQTVLKLKKHGYWIYSSDLSSESKNFRNIQYNSKSALILGNEGNGVSHILKQASDVLIHIPMNPVIDSLNVSVAAGILLFEMAKFDTN